MIWLAYAAVILALGLAVGERLKQVREARERLNQFKHRARVGL